MDMEFRRYLLLCMGEVKPKQNFVGGVLQMKTCLQGMVFNGRNTM